MENGAATKKQFPNQSVDICFDSCKLKWLDFFNIFSIAKYNTDYKNINQNKKTINRTSQTLPTLSL